MNWLWKQTEWPHFVWINDKLNGLLRETIQIQGQLLGKAEAAGDDFSRQSTLDTLLHNIISSSAIEDEELNVESVRSSLARRLGLATGHSARTTARTEGLADLILDATGNIKVPLSMDRLFQWHRLLFPPGSVLPSHALRVGSLRGDFPMQVVSGRLDQPTVHFQAPPLAGLEGQLAEFIQWFNRSRFDPSVDPLIRAGLAHLWFVTLHPFEDGNGRLARAIADLALAQAEQRTIRLYTMSAAILKRRRDYYRILESSQRGTMDVTPWLLWFLGTLQLALKDSSTQIDGVLEKARFWQTHAGHSLIPAQVKVLNRLLEGGPDNFELGISASQYESVARVSKATATRHLADLVGKGFLEKKPGGGRSTRYHIPGRN
jgi:Fic family protein